jgi:hypothetical protein
VGAPGGGKDMMRTVYYVKNIDKDTLEFISTDERECYKWKMLKMYSMDRREVGEGVILTGDEAFYFKMGAF